MSSACFTFPSVENVQHRGNGPSELREGGVVAPWEEQQQKWCQKEFLLPSPAPEMLSLGQDLFAGDFGAV